MRRVIDGCADSFGGGNAMQKSVQDDDSVLRTEADSSASLRNDKQKEQAGEKGKQRGRLKLEAGGERSAEVLCERGEAGELIWCGLFEDVLDLAGDVSALLVAEHA